MSETKATNGRPGAHKDVPVQIAFNQANGASRLPLNSWPTSPCQGLALHLTMRNEDSMRFAIPTLRGTFTSYTLRGSRRIGVSILHLLELYTSEPSALPANKFVDHSGCVRVDFFVLSHTCLMTRIEVTLELGVSR